MDLISNKASKMSGEVKVPGDKSISHRAAMFLPIARGNSEIHNFLFSEDCVHTLRAMRMLGANVEICGDIIKVSGCGKDLLKTPPSAVYLGNSGTSMRLLSGIFSALKGTSILYGDNSLNKRPMNRIIKPLSMMGANIGSVEGNGKAPLVIEGRKLSGINYEMEVASAQVKSSILIATLFSEGKTRIIEKKKTRDHTERMLKFLGCDILEDASEIQMNGGQIIEGNKVEVPGDASSAAFLIGAALLVPNSELIIKNVLLNPTRTGFLDIAKKMGGNIEILDMRSVNNEDVGDVRVRSSELNSVIIQGEEIPRLIDEIPLIALIAAFAEGKTIIRNAEELKHKESDRIKSVVSNLIKMGINVEELEDGMIIDGKKFKNQEGIVFDSFGDHRIAMAFSLCGLLFNNIRVLNCDSISTSFPEYIRIMNSIGANMYTK